MSCSQSEFYSRPKLARLLSEAVGDIDIVSQEINSLMFVKAHAPLLIRLALTPKLQREHISFTFIVSSVYGRQKRSTARDHQTPEYYSPQALPHPSEFAHCAENCMCAHLISFPELNSEWNNTHCGLGGGSKCLAHDWMKFLTAPI